MVTLRELVFQFSGFLTTRETPITLSGKHDAAPMAKLTDDWCNDQDLDNHVVMTLAEHTVIQEELAQLNALKAAGVDNWEGYDEATRMIAELKHVANTDIEGNPRT